MSRPFPFRERPRLLPVEDPHLPSGDLPLPSLVPSIAVLVTDVHHPIDIVLRTGQEMVGRAVDATRGAGPVEVERARADDMSRPAVVRDALDDESDLVVALHRAVRAISCSRRFVHADLRVRGEGAEEMDNVPPVDSRR